MRPACESKRRRKNHLPRESVLHRQAACMWPVYSLKRRELKQLTLWCFGMAEDNKEKHAGSAGLLTDSRDRCNAWAWTERCGTSDRHPSIRGPTEPRTRRSLPASPPKSDQRTSGSARSQTWVRPMLGVGVPIMGPHLQDAAQAGRALHSVSPTLHRGLQYRNTIKSP